MTAIQRFGGALQVHVHFHLLVAEGIWDGPKFVPLSIKDEDVRAIVAVAAARILRKAVARGLVELDDEGVMTLIRPEVADEEKQQELALLQATAPRPRSGGTRKEEFPRRRRYHARSSGFDLDAGVRIAASDRTGLERLSRYLLRGPVASDRLVALPDGRFELTLKRAWRDGTCSFVWTGEELVGKLAALVAPFRQKLVRYHGILAPNHPQREAVVSKVRTRRKRRRGERMPWAELLKRVWGTDALRCSKCGGWRTICASITDGVVARRILLWVGIDPDLPRFVPLRC